jgi:hypothetical protein
LTTKSDGYNELFLIITPHRIGVHPNAFIFVYLTINSCLKEDGMAELIESVQTRTPPKEIK